MKPKVKARYEMKAKVIKAMGHPTRLFIVDELKKRARCVNDLTAMIGDDISTVSKHLSVLKNAGIVSDEKKGSQVFYTLCVPCVTDFFTCVESVLRERARRQAALLR